MVPDIIMRLISLMGAIGGRPSVADDRARSSPARTLSRIIARSNSLNTDSIPNSIRPDGVDVSRACLVQVEIDLPRP